jgi:hypothetical protein
MTTPDYAIEMRDGTGRTTYLHINGACIDELVAAGYDHQFAIESAESNAFEKSIERKEIGRDAWVV